MPRASGRLTSAVATGAAEIPGLVELWGETLGDARVCVAVLDGPVDQSHPSLAAANLRRLETLVPNLVGPGPSCRHGTHISSVIFGQHDGPIAGIAPQCRGLIVPVFRDTSDASIALTSQLDLARAIEQAVQAGADIVNVSGGELSGSGTAHPLLADAVRNCARSNVLLVAAAGNEGCDCLHVPGALPSVLAVGATDSQGLPLGASNWGRIYRSQGVLAPGENIPGATPGGGTTTNSGTSYASAVVAGIAALLLSLQLKRRRKPDPHRVRAAILGSATACEGGRVPDCRRWLAGRLNVKRAAAQLMEEGGTVTDLEETQEAIPSEGGETARRPLAQTAPGIPTAQASRSAPAEPEAARRVTERGPAAPGSFNAAAVRPGVHASECSCPEGGPCTCNSPAAAQLVFALGTLGYDFGTEARRDSILQHMGASTNAYDPNQLLGYLEKNPWDAAAILWTVNLDATPIYAIQAQGAFAGEIYKRLRDFLAEQTRGEVERVSIPGHIMGAARLSNGQVVPVIVPDPRGMYSWNTTALVEAVSGPPPKKGASQEEKDAYARKAQPVAGFLRRVYDEMRNLGITPQDRAMNYAATNAFQVAEVFSDVIKHGMDLDTMAVERSPICRPESDCWDVKLTCFNPNKMLEQARKVYRFAIDVSDVVPVMVGSVRSWYVR